MDKKLQHIKTKNKLIYDVGQIVMFKRNAKDLSSADRRKVWIVKEYVNKGPEECSVYDYLLTDGSDEVVAIEYELKTPEE